MRKKATAIAAALLIGLSPGVLSAQQRQLVPDRLGTEAFSSEALTIGKTDKTLRASAASGERTAPTTRAAILGTYLQDSHNQTAGTVSFMGELTISASAGENEISISNFFSAGGTFYGLVNPSAGTITIQAGQVVGTLADGSTLRLYPADFDNLRYFNQPFDATVSPKGIIRFPEMIIIASGSTSGQIRCYGDEWFRYNAQMTDYSLWNEDNPVNTYSIHYSRTTPTQFLIKNFGGHGAAVKCANDTVGNVSVPRTAIGSLATSASSTMVLYNYAVTSIDRTITPPQPTLNNNATKALFQADSIVINSWCSATGSSSSSKRSDLLEKSVIRVPASEAWTDISTAVDFQGKGTKEDPYLITSAADLERLSLIVNNNTGLRVNKVVFDGKYFAQTADIDLEDVEVFEPIGGTTDYKFGGIYDGRNHIIANLKVNENRGTSYRTGLFGELGSNAEVCSLTIKDPVIRSSYAYVGTLAGYSAGFTHHINVVNADIYDDNQSASYIGGLVGLIVNNARVEDVVMDGGSITGNDLVGSVTGNVNGAKIRRAVSDMNVIRLASRSSTPRFGGITAVITRDTSAIEDCLYFGAMQLSGNEIAGGIVANPDKGQVLRSQFAGRILHQGTTSSTAIIGGITGQAKQTRIRDCHVSGIIQSYLSPTVGGIIGKLTGDNSEITGNLFTGSLLVSGDVRRNEIASETDGSTMTNNIFDAQASYNYGSEGGLNTTALSGETLPAGLNTEAWTAQEGKYPVLTALRDNKKVKLDAVPFFLAQGENLRNIRSAFTLGEGNDVRWSLLHNLSYSTQGNGLSISGNNVTVTATILASDTLVALSADGKLFRMYCLKVVPHEFDGEGTAASPYLIHNRADMDRLFHAVDAEFYDYTGTHFRVEGDIDFSGVSNFGGYSNIAPAYAFNGVLDGNGHTIRNLVMSEPSKATDTGAFMLYTGPDSEISNFIIDSSCKFIGGNYVAFVAQAHGTLRGIVNLADVTAYSDGAAGIAGQLASTGKIINCYNGGHIRGARQYVGGIAAFTVAGSEISGCQNSGNISNELFGLFNTESKQLIYSGGIIGAAAGSINNCLNQGMITGGEYSGGIVGTISGTDTTGIQACINTGIVLETGSDRTRGAIAGYISGNRKMLNNYYDMQFSAQAAAGNADHDGIEGVCTSELTAGKLLQGCDADLWQFTADTYPVLKAFANQSASQWYSSARVEFATEPRVETRFDKRSDAKVCLPEGSSATLAVGTVFKVTEGKLVHPTSTQSAIDTLTLASADGRYYLTAPLFATPKLLANGSGTADDPYIINTPNDWNSVAFYTNENHKSLVGEHFRIGADIDFNGNFEPICFDGSTLFAGVIDGNHKTISRAVYDDETVKYIGIIGRAGTSAQVYNLTLDSTVNFNGNQYVGGIAGSFGGKIWGIVNYGTISTAKMQYAGGVVGLLTTGALIYDCINHGTINSYSNGGGGIAGSSEPDVEIRDCSNYGQVTSKGSAGGIMGSSKTSVTNCHNYGKVISTSGSSGGIVGYLWNTVATSPIVVSKCENTSVITAAGNGCGGIVGTIQSNGRVFDCVNRADISNTYANTGGIVGQASTANSSWRIGRVENFGNISGTYSIGGILGNSGSGAKTEAEYAYIDSAVNHGSVTAGKTYNAGGIAGQVGNYVQIRNAWNYGSVTTKTYGAGGIVGTSTGSVDNTYNQGNVTAGSYSAGGIMGQSYTSTAANYGCRISNSVNVGKVQSLGTIDSNCARIGGILGHGRAAVENCVNQSDLTGRQNVGGIVGLPIKGTSATVLGTQVINCYNVGRVECTVEAKRNTCGMIVGENTTAVTNVNYSNNYYDSQMAGNSVSTEYADYGKDYAKGVTGRALMTANLGDGFTTGQDGYPVIRTHAGKPYAPLAFSAVIFAEDNHADLVKASFHVTQASSMTWSADNMTFSEHGTAMWSNANLDDLTPLTATLGDYSRTVYLKIANSTDVNAVDNDADVLQIQWYDLRGTRLNGPTAGICVRVLIYADGTSRSEKVFVKE